MNELTNVELDDGVVLCKVRMMTVMRSQLREIRARVDGPNAYHRTGLAVLLYPDSPGEL